MTESFIEHYSSEAQNESVLSDVSAAGEAACRQAGALTYEDEHGQQIQCLTWSAVQNAKAVLRRSMRVLKQYPELPEMFEAYQVRHPGHTVVMAVFSELPLIVSPVRRGIRLFAPVTGCSLQAVNALQRKYSAMHFMTHSDNGLLERVMTMAVMEEVPVLSFKPNMNPADYLALGLTGWFFNEPFCVRYVDGSIKPEYT